MKLDLAGLNSFQQRAVLIIQRVNGDDDARKLIDTYVADNIAGCEEYSLDELVPIPAKCQKCKRNWVGADMIRAPSLDGCRCAYCGGSLVHHSNYPRVVTAKEARHGLFLGKDA